LTTPLSSGSRRHMVRNISYSDTYQACHTSTDWQETFGPQVSTRRRVHRITLNWNGPGSSLSRFSAFHESSDDSDHREHHGHVRRADGSNRQRGNPLGGPGDKQNQWDMKGREDRHGAQNHPCRVRFRFTTMTKHNIPMLTSVGNAISNLPNWSNTQ
jgi:hypothetical protein